MFYDHVSLVAPSKIEVCILTQFEKMHLLYSTSLFFWCYWMFEGSFICHANTLPTILWLHALISKCNWIWNFWKRYKSIFVKDLFRSIDFVSMCSPLWLNCFMAYNELKLLNMELWTNIVVRFFNRIKCYSRKKIYTYHLRLYHKTHLNMLSTKR